MTPHLVPELGLRGLYRVKAPFDTVLDASTEYTCQSVRRISELLASGEDVFETYYKSYGITAESYENDLINNVVIIGLNANRNNWYYFPSSYLLSYPDITGVVYNKIIMGIDLGALADSVSLEPLKTAIRDLVYDHLGINPEVKEVIASQTLYLSKEDHAKIENVRTARRSITKSNFQVIRELEASNLVYSNKLKALEKFIIDNRVKLGI
jgi:hypothetical protein